MSRQARLTALIERGFAALEGGDIEAAERRRDEAGRIDRHHPQLSLLDAAIAHCAGDLDRALAAYQALFDTAVDTDAHLGAAEVLLEQGEHHGAALHLERVLPGLAGEERADVLYDLAGCRDELGDHRRTIELLLEVRQLDCAAPLPPWHLEVDDFEIVAAKALAELPDDVQERLANVPILIDDVPAEALVKDGIDPRILGLFSGTPMADILSVGGAPQLTTIHLYWRNLERATTSAEELAEEIRITVLHETAHFFGLDDDDLAERGLD